MMDTGLSYKSFVQTRYCIGCHETSSITKTLPCCQTELCMGCFSVLQVQGPQARSIQATRMYHCPACRKQSPQVKLLDVKAQGHFHATVSLTRSLRTMWREMKAIKKQERVAAEPGRVVETQTKEETVIAGRSVAYPPSRQAMTVTVEPEVLKSPQPAVGRMDLFSGAVGKRKQLPVQFLLMRNKVEFLHKEFSDVVGLV
ncbi:hypothetical protein BC830DRAFT_558678 [Chytriomyces sp. MP71]|nr:hypothetical protein BC830DRAFT_558678 [Chytriomyces sp. MP71]